VANRARGGTGCPYCAGTRPTPGGCLAATHPALAREWHPTRNGALRPTLVSAGSNRLAWWRCEAGHEWWARIRYRSQDHPDCPACARARARAERSLAAMSPSVAAEWHPARNGALTADQVGASSRRQTWWRCATGHEWSATIAARVREGRGCPACDGTSLAASHPRVAAGWHRGRNGRLGPLDVTAGSGREAWWRCPAGHEWQRAVRLQVAWPMCPQCRALAGESPRRRWGPLDRSHPELAGQWHPEYNGDLLPRQVSAGSKRRIWWRCADGHEWEAPIDRRAIRGGGCPGCARVGVASRLVAA
jgi:hypothetical protein